LSRFRSRLLLADLAKSPGIGGAFLLLAADSPASAKATEFVTGSGVAMNGGNGEPRSDPIVGGRAALTLPSSSVGGATEAIPPFALPDNVSSTREKTISESSTWAIVALRFAGRGHAGFRSNRRKPIWIDEAKA
jgi:hypothetical protein